MKICMTWSSVTLKYKSWVSYRCQKTIYPYLCHTIRVLFQFIIDKLHRLWSFSIEFLWVIQYRSGWFFGKGKKTQEKISRGHTEPSFKEEGGNDLTISVYVIYKGSNLSLLSFGSELNVKLMLKNIAWHMTWKKNVFLVYRVLFVLSTVGMACHYILGGCVFYILQF